MQVNIGPIRRQQGASAPLQFRIEKPDSVVNQLKFAPDVPLRFDGAVSNTGRGYLVEGRIQAELDLTCGRCLKGYRWSLETSLCERFCPAEVGRPLPESDDDEEFGDDEVDDVHHFHGEQFDLTDSVREQILVSLPMKRVCRDDCAGLCPTCGSDLAAAPCTCTKETTDIRLAPLAEWFASQQGASNDDDKS